MNQDDFNELIAPGRFSPFVIVTHDGFALAIGAEQAKHLVVGKRMMVALDAQGDIVHIPYSSIAHIQEPK